MHHRILKLVKPLEANGRIGSQLMEPEKMDLATEAPEMKHPKVVRFKYINKLCYFIKPHMDELIRYGGK